MIKIIGDNYRIYGLIIVKLPKKSLMLDNGFSNATFEPPNHAFTLKWYWWKPLLGNIIHMIFKWWCGFRNFHRLNEKQSFFIKDNIHIIEN
jgi:hypothetical protein